MLYSRIRRHEEKILKTRLLAASLGIMGLLAFLFLFGVKTLIGFSLFVDKIRGNAPPAQQQPVPLLPPILDPIPEATNSGNLLIAGTAAPEVTAIIYVDDTEKTKVTVPKDGKVSFPVALSDGNHTISAKLTDEKGAISELSNVLRITIKKGKPQLSLTSPDDNASVIGDTNKVTVRGKTDPDNEIRVNGRLAPVLNDGSFELDVPLPEGSTTIAITATDEAGNETKIERHVSYQK